MAIHFWSWRWLKVLGSLQKCTFQETKRLCKKKNNDDNDDARPIYCVPCKFKKLNNFLNNRDEVKHFFFGSQNCGNESELTKFNAPREIEREALELRVSLRSSFLRPKNKEKVRVIVQLFNDVYNCQTNIFNYLGLFYFILK